MVLCRLPLRLLVCFLVSLAGCVPPWLPVPLSDVAPNPRILVFEFVGIQHSICLCDISVFFQFSEITSGQDALPTVLNSGFVHTLPTVQVPSALTDSFSWGHDPFTLACKARPSFDGCGTSLSVSLSLSLSTLHFGHNRLGHYHISVASIMSLVRR